MFKSSTLPRILRSTTILFLMGTLTASAQTTGSQEMDIDVLRELTDRWIQLELERAKARNEWEESKFIYEQQIKTLEDEKRALQAEIESFEKLTESRSEEMRAITDALDEKRDFLREIEGMVPEIETRLLEAAAAFPPPLRTELDSQLAGMAETAAGEDTALARRIQRILTVLTTAERFNNTLTLFPEIREVDGREVQVQVLYWGLAAGYAVQPELDLAWLVRPGAGGWQWTPANEHAVAIADLIAIYEKRKEPGIRMLPVNLEGAQ